MDMAQFLIALITATGFALKGAAALIRALISWRWRRVWGSVAKVERYYL